MTVLPQQTRTSSDGFLKSFLGASLVLALGNIGALGGLYWYYGIYDPLPGAWPAYLIFGVIWLLSVAAFLRMKWAEHFRASLGLVDMLVIAATLIEIIFFGQQVFRSFTHPFIDKRMVEASQLRDYAAGINSHKNPKRIGNFVADHVVFRGPLLAHYYKNEAGDALPDQEALKKLFKDDACSLFASISAVKLAAINYTITNVSYSMTVHFAADDCKPGDKTPPTVAVSDAPAPAMGQPAPASAGHETSQTPVVAALLKNANEVMLDEVADQLSGKIDKLKSNLDSLQQGIDRLLQTMSNRLPAPSH